MKRTSPFSPHNTEARSIKYVSMYCTKAGSSGHNRESLVLLALTAAEDQTTVIFT